MARALRLCAAFALLALSAHAQRSSRLQMPRQEDCETIDLYDRIYGGEEAVIGQYPWLALLQYQSRDGKLAFLCGGALVSPRHVLTAAHCVQSTPGRTLVNVRLGEFNLDEKFDCLEPLPSSKNASRVCADPPLDVEPERLIPHPGYRGEDSSFQDDIALVQLSQDVAFTEFIRPICLPTPQEANTTYEGQSLTVAGWGRTETQSGSRVLLQAQVPVVGSAQCAAKFRVEARLPVDGARQLCAGGGVADACRGDSGGPLVWMGPGLATRGARFVAAGIASYGSDPCAKRGWPGIYTRVAHYVPWLRRNLRS